MPALIHTRAPYTTSKRCPWLIRNFYAITPMVSLALRLLVYHRIISATRGRARFTERQTYCRMPIESRAYPPRGSKRVDVEDVDSIHDRTEVTRPVCSRQTCLRIHSRSLRPPVSRKRSPQYLAPLAYQRRGIVILAVAISIYSCATLQVIFQKGETADGEN